MGKIFFYIIKMAPFMLLAIIPLFIWRFTAIFFMKKKQIKTTFLHEFILAVFMLFLAGLASQTILPQSVIGDLNLKFVFTKCIFNDLNLIPLNMFYDLYVTIFEKHEFDYFFINIIGNIVMFMPIGFFPPLLFQRIAKPKKHSMIYTATLIGGAASLFIEICQLPFMRKSDIDDVILNTFGAFLGCLIYRFVSERFPVFSEKFKIKKHDN